MEKIIAIIFGVFVFCIVLYWLYARGLEADQIKNRMEIISKDKKLELVLDEDLNKPLMERFIKPLINGIIGHIKRLMPENKKVNKTSIQKDDKLKKQLRLAGLHMDVSEYRAVQILAIAGMTFVMGFGALLIKGRMQSVLLFALIGAYMGFVALKFFIARRISNRKESISRQLPEVLDMLSVCVEAGLGLEQAMLHVNNHFKGPLIDELSIAYREMSMGRTRKDALLAMAERTQVGEISSFVRAVVQAGQMGISIKNVLQSQSELMRQTRRNKVEEKAMQVSVKILIPMALFIFPVMFIVLLGPAAINIYNQFLNK